MAGAASVTLGARESGAGPRSRCDSGGGSGLGSPHLDGNAAAGEHLLDFDRGRAPLVRHGAQPPHAPAAATDSRRFRTPVDSNASWALTVDKAS
jgi:hypothetical protein